MKHVTLSPEAVAAVKQVEKACAVLNRSIDKVRRCGFTATLTTAAVNGSSTPWLEIHIEAALATPTVDDLHGRSYLVGYEQEKAVWAL